MGQRPDIILAKSAGFCFGVDRAVKTVFKSVDESKSRVYTLGEIIHNNTINNKLKEKGVIIENDYKKIPKNADVVIRAHGVPEKVYTYFEENGISFIDATCPFVAKIHKIVSEIPAKNSVILIAGNPDHPEVIGIKGFCNAPVFVFDSCSALEDILANNTEVFRNSQMFMVSQTTFSLSEWEKCVKKVNFLCTKPTIFDTICKATEERQREAEELSKKCDRMVVIGARHSSNTVKLFNLCEKNCKTCLIETAKELDMSFFDGAEKIGVTAGASTPSVIIKEVLEAMSEVKNTIVNDADDFDFATALEESLTQMSTDQKVKGVVVGITPTEIQVDIGRKQTGYITYAEYSYDPNVNPAEDCKIGDEINVVIMKTNDAEGTIMLSKKRFDSANAWDELEACVESGEFVEGTVTDIIKGGLIATTAKGIRVFIPGSLSGVSKSESMDSLLKTKVTFKVIEVNKQRRRAVGSIKAVIGSARKEAQEKFWANAEVGQVYTGVVKSLTNYGAFVDIGGVDGMIHISELSWKRIKHPSEVLNVGDTVEVFIKALEDNKISLGYKKEEDNPWVILKNTYSEGDIIDAKIVGMTTFGAFANVIDGIDGLIHISQIANRHIEKPQDVLKIGDEVKVKITEIDYDKKRVSLSIRALLPIEDESAGEVAEETTVEAPSEAEVVPAEETPVEVEAAPAKEAVEEVPAETETPAEEAPTEE